MNSLLTKLILSMNIVLLGFATFPVFAVEQPHIKNIASTNMDWKVTPEGAAFASLKGNRFVESYMAMVKLPAGIVSPMHVKSANMFGVVISGTFSHIAQGAEPSTEVLLPPGSYYMIPAGLAHISKCVSKVECISFLYQDGKFDFVPTQQPISENSK